mmetsp:Transcript_153805/g.493193  ORF Transcript_153805/g.493193 Transcript_153805/m.493193 type:complete len:214 (-) Transcript_153805:543-1184(-)
MPCRLRNHSDAAVGRFRAFRLLSRRAVVHAMALHPNAIPYLVRHRPRDGVRHALCSEHLVQQCGLVLLGRICECHDPLVHLFDHVFAAVRIRGRQVVQADAVLRRGRGVHAGRCSQRGCILCVQVWRRSRIEKRGRGRSSFWHLSLGVVRALRLPPPGVVRHPRRQVQAQRIGHSCLHGLACGDNSTPINFLGGQAPAEGLGGGYGCAEWDGH